MDWTAGYVTEIEYTYGYYRELCPGLLRLACLSAGIAPPNSKALNYLELGYGQGLSLNIHAAANAGEFWGTDFNPVQTAHARAFAEASGSNVKALNDSFAELSARSDLPEFDVIALHGIWTWISEETAATSSISSAASLRSAASCTSVIVSPDGRPLRRFVI
jgi:predicted nicotinamide N-methyase